MKKTRPLHFRAFTLEDGHFEFEVTGRELAAEVPKVRGCYDLSIREYEVRAAYKKAATITPNRVRSLCLLNA